MDQAQRSHPLLGQVLVKTAIKLTVLLQIGKWLCIPVGARN